MVGDVEGEAIGTFYGGGSRCELLNVATVQHHVGAGTGEASGERETDALGSPRDERAPPGQIEQSLHRHRSDLLDNALGISLCYR